MAAGHEVIIAKAGKPVARLAALAGDARPERLGLLEGNIEVPDNFDKPLDEAELPLFE